MKAIYFIGLYFILTTLPAQAGDGLERFRQIMGSIAEQKLEGLTTTDQECTVVYRDYAMSNIPVFDVKIYENNSADFKAKYQIGLGYEEQAREENEMSLKTTSYLPGGSDIEPNSKSTMTVIYDHDQILSVKIVEKKGYFWNAIWTTFAEATCNISLN